MDPSQSWSRRWWRLARVLIAPVLILLLLGAVLVSTFTGWLESNKRYDDAALREWVDESRNAERTLSDRVDAYLKQVKRYAAVKKELAQARKQGNDGQGGFGSDEGRLEVRFLDASAALGHRHQEIHQHLRSLGDPVTKMYPGQLPLFPVIYSMEVLIDLDGLVPEEDRQFGDVRLDRVEWDSGQEPGPEGRAQDFSLGSRARIRVEYQLHAWNRRQRDEQVRVKRLQQLGLLAIAVTVLGLAWLFVLQADQREQERRQRLAQEKIAATERDLLEQQLATQAAEQKALELRSNLYRDRSVMAGSYAHNIRNLLVLPNDLLARCLEEEQVQPTQRLMLGDVVRTLGTVDDWLKRLLESVRRDPERAERKILDLNVALAELQRTWSDVATHRWRLDLTFEPTGEALWIEADEAHLQQAVENLLFNARDATFEMRNLKRDQARTATDLKVRQQANLEAARWRGKVTIRSRREGDWVILEVIDNGVGMPEDVRRRCTESHFTTKRNNALYEGMHTGMGLGLSFVAAIVQHHQATLEIDSAPHQGATFRIRFPAKSAEQNAAKASTGT